MQVVITHAYSARNSGDGLLVDQTVALIHESLGENVEITVVAQEPGSFSEHSNVIHPATGTSDTPSKAKYALSMITRGLHPYVVEKMAQADLVLGVGGGYLRASSVAEYLKVALTHLPQLPHGSRHTPAIYMPQSVGPFPARGLPTFAGGLSRTHLLAVRDDRSLREAQNQGINAVRYPDLAVLAIAQHDGVGPGSGEHGESSGDVGLVLRHLSRKRKYETAISRLLGFERVVPLIQSTGRGNNDPDYYRSLGVREPVELLSDRLRGTRRPSLTVSVRLHGSLQSILSGVPSIHLSYERKGWGAYEDLGISEFVHNARDFDVELVIRQIDTLRSNPHSYWNSIRQAAPALARQREDLVSAIRNCVIGP